MQTVFWIWIYKWLYSDNMIAFCSFLTITKISLVPFFSSWLFLYNCYYSKTSIVCNFIQIDFYLWLTTKFSVSGNLSAVHSAVLSVGESFRPGLDVCFSIRHYRNACFSSLAVRGDWVGHSLMESFCWATHEGRPQSEFAASTACAHK